ncbi:MAG: hypothetical protein PSX37_02240 [bacterium]|nr:hypothetical protein [bacterium]
MDVFDEIYSPSAASAREHLDRRHEQVIPTPSPGDRLLSEGRVVIEGHVIGETGPIS